MYKSKLFFFIFVICLIDQSLAQSLGQPTISPKIDVHLHTQPRYFELTDTILQANGIVRWINLSGGSQLKLLAQQIETAQAFEDRVAICVNIPWKLLSNNNFEEKIASFLSESKRLGAKCIKIPKSLGLFIPDPTRLQSLLRIDDPRLDIIWQQAGQLDLPIFIHIGDPWAFFEPLTPNNERYDELSVHPDWSFHDPKYPGPQQLLQAFEVVLHRFPQTIFIGVHFANCAEDLDYVRYALHTYPNLYADIAARLPEFGRHPAPQVKALFEAFPDRFLFGTDLGLGSQIMLGSVGKDQPEIIDIFEFYEAHWQFFESNQSQIKHPTPIQGNWKIDAIGLSKATLEKLYYFNALRLIWKIEKPDELQKQWQKDQDQLKTRPSIFEVNTGLSF